MNTKNCLLPKNQLNRTEHVVYVEDCQIDTDLELLFPDDYISNVTERMSLYRELDQVQQEEDLVKFETGTDRPVWTVARAQQGIA